MEYQLHLGQVYGYSKASGYWYVPAQTEAAACTWAEGSKGYRNMRKVRFLVLETSPSQKNVDQVPLTLRNLDVISWIKAKKV